MNFKIFNKISNKQKIVFFPIAFVVFVFVINYFIILPSVKKIKEIRTEILNQKIELKNNIKQSENINRLNEELKSIKPKMDKLDQIFINKNRELEFIVLIESIADKYSIDQKIDLNPNLEDPEDLYKQSPMTLGLRGQYVDIMHYLFELEKIKYYININSIDISAVTQNQRVNNISGEDMLDEEVVMNLNADVYWKNN